MQPFEFVLLAILVSGLAIVGLVILYYLVIRRIVRRHRVPPNQVMVIYGKGKTAFREDGSLDPVGVRMITGGGTWVWSIWEDYGFLDLTIMTIAKAKDEVYTVDGVPIRLDWVAQVQIESSESSLITAARAFLGMPRDEVKNVIAQTLSANFRAIVGQLTVEDVHRDRDAFVQRVQELASDDMRAMGVVVISMGIEEITDDQGYFEAMAKPVIAVVKRDALIAEAEADREARIKAANARREAQQAELDADRAIIEQREALELREVEKAKTVGLAQAGANEEVQKRKAAAVVQQQEAEVLVPARSQREAAEIQADAERRKVTITAEARAQATRTEAAAQAEATEVTGRADAEKLKAMKLAEADGARATLLAEAEGKAKLAEATAAEGEINLRQVIAQALIDAEVKKMEALGLALQGVGENVRIVQFGGAEGATNSSALLETLKTVPELAAIINAKTEALSGENLEQVLAKIAQFISAGKPGSAPVEEKTSPPAKGTSRRPSSSRRKTS
jgi:flotillin